MLITEKNKLKKLLTDIYDLRQDYTGKNRKKSWEGIFLVPAFNLAIKRIKQILNWKRFSAKKAIQYFREIHYKIMKKYTDYHDFLWKELSFNEDWQNKLKKIIADITELAELDCYQLSLFEVKDWLQPNIFFQEKFDCFKNWVRKQEQKQLNKLINQVKKQQELTPEKSIHQRRAEEANPQHFVQLSLKFSL